MCNMLSQSQKRRRRQRKSSMKCASQGDLGLGSGMGLGMGLRLGIGMRDLQFWGCDRACPIELDEWGVPRHQRVRYCCHYNALHLFIAPLPLISHAICVFVFFWTFLAESKNWSTIFGNAKTQIGSWTLSCHTGFKVDWVAPSFHAVWYPKICWGKEICRLFSRWYLHCWHLASHAMRKCNSKWSKSS